VLKHPTIVIQLRKSDKAEYKHNIQYCYCIDPNRLPECIGYQIPKGSLLTFVAFEDRGIRGHVIKEWGFMESDPYRPGFPQGWTALADDYWTFEEHAGATSERLEVDAVQAEVTHDAAGEIALAAVPFHQRAEFAGRGGCTHPGDSYGLTKGASSYRIRRIRKAQTQNYILAQKKTDRAVS
jgi:hypothetical protein